MSHSSSFDERLNSYILPQPGPEYYATRRALWLSRPEQAQSQEQPHIPHPVGIQKLAKALSAPGAVQDDRLWKQSLNKIWKGFSSGASLVERLPMRVVVRIVHAAWLRDSTWPANAQAPEPDDELPPDADTTKQAMPPLVLKRDLDTSAKSQMTRLD
ncbi:hypothetical protein CCMSSC00406_0000992 [Pleurotus cornucopiae]|uniref:Uncharacterized protein n=1 Tax=Pleurotus cornucopiae TaxID=5321 RepID=A0ACB7IL56_PLECO|nr:hypothetical protein CCMSSC00406_0000992 [Pleurotus cornucopiae]